MHRTRIAYRPLGVGVALVLLSGASLAAQRASQTVTYRVDAVDQLSVQGSPSLTIVSAVAGRALTSATASGSTWSITTNQINARITASLTSEMPTGLTLSVMLTPPQGAVSAGLKPLGTAPVELVSGLSRVAAAGLPLTYQLDAAPTAGVVAAGSRVVIFTITGGM